MSNIFDKIKIMLPLRWCETLPTESFNKGLGFSCSVQYEMQMLFLILSGKIVSTETSLGGLSRDNFGIALKIVSDKTGIILPFDEIYKNATVCAVDVKKDIKVAQKTENYISSFRELANQHTFNTEVMTFGKDIGYAESILIKPITKKRGDSFTIYSKYQELLLRQNRLYRSQFTFDFLEECKNVIRFERRLTSFAAIRNAFKIQHKGSVSPNELLEADFDVVQERIMKLIGGYKYGKTE